MLSGGIRCCLITGVGRLCRGRLRHRRGEAAFHQVGNWRQGKWNTAKKTSNAIILLQKHANQGSAQQDSVHESRRCTLQVGNLRMVARRLRAARHTTRCFLPSYFDFCDCLGQTLLVDKDGYSSEDGPPTRTSRSNRTLKDTLPE